MLGVEPVLVFVGLLNELGAKYMVTGSVASIAYGEPRLTHDIDIVVELDRVQAGLLVIRFPAPEFYCPPVEIIRTELARDAGGILTSSTRKADSRRTSIPWATIHVRRGA